MSVTDIVHNGLLMASEKMIGMIGQPGTERGLRLLQVVVDIGKEKVMITGKNAITKLVQIVNGFNSLMGHFTFMKFSVSTMTLVSAELPNGKNGIKH